MLCLPRSASRSRRAVDLRNSLTRRVNIDWVIPCRYVEVHDNLGTIVGAGIDTYWVAQLPAQLQVVVAVRLLATAEELEENAPHPVANRIRDARGDVVSEVAGEVSFQGSSARPEWLAGIVLGTVVQFEATEEGTYTLEHVVDDSSEQLPIHIVVGVP